MSDIENKNTGCTLGGGIQLGDQIIPESSMMPQYKDNIVKEIKVWKLLDQMIDCDKQLYEQILDTPGFAFYFNELVKLAQK